jgi:hypothetical protein
MLCAVRRYDALSGAGVPTSVPSAVGPADGQVTLNTATVLCGSLKQSGNHFALKSKNINYCIFFSNYLSVYYLTVMRTDIPVSPVYLRAADLDDADASGIVFVCFVSFLWTQKLKSRSLLMFYFKMMRRNQQKEETRKKNKVDKPVECGLCLQLEMATRASNYGGLQGTRAVCVKQRSGSLLSRH